MLASESWANAELGLGRHGELAAGLEALCREHPLRERLWELLILALYRAGRQAEALRAYTEIRDRLAGELGIDPGPALRDLEARILTHHPSLSPEPAPPAPGSAVPAALLETKFYVPRSRRDLVPRPRLAERLDRGSGSKLMLVSAPAGFGKTTLLTEWLAAGPAAPADQRLAAWLSLDQGDNDPASFWTYVIAALRTAAPGVGENALALLQASGPPPVEAVLTTLLNDLSAVAGDIVLVLDDYHVIDARGVQDGMAFLLDHLPTGLHVVIAGRADPALPLARLRARGELAEIRAAELRFTPDEAAAYLNEMMGLQLTARDVAALEGRTEGWIAALQLAALSMQGRDDVAGFIAGFAGDDRYVVDYLIEEVLQRQPDRVQAFLLQTSILGRLSGPLCDAVTGQAGGKAMLEALDRGNLFMVPLDDRRQWYRYHHLFADVLQARLLDEQPDQVPDLHRRASAWYQRSGEQSVAIGHALAAEDFSRAADLVELAISAMSQTRQEATVRGWLEMIPDEVIRVRPVLSVAFAWVLLSVGEFEGVEARLRDAERWLDATTGDRSRDPQPRRQRWSWPTRRNIVASRGRSSCIVPRRRWLGASRSARSGMHEGRLTLRLRRTIARVLRHRDSWASRSGGAGISRQGTWHMPNARRDYGRAGHIADIFGCAIAMADIRLAQGRLGEAMRTYEQALQRAPEQGGPGSAGNGRHVRGDERGPPRTRRSAGRHAASCCGARSWATTPGCRRTGIAGGSRWPGYARLKGIWTARSTCSTRRSGCMRATSSRTCGRSRRCGQESGSRRADSVKHSAGRVSRACPLTTTSVTCASSSTSPWPGSSWRGTRTSVPSTTRTRRPGSWSASCRRRKRAAGPDASSKSWCFRRSRTRH